MHFSNKYFLLIIITFTVMFCTFILEFVLSLECVLTYKYNELEYAID